jgi:hypothetical protein
MEAGGGRVGVAGGVLDVFEGLDVPREVGNRHSGGKTRSEYSLDSPAAFSGRFIVEAMLNCLTSGFCVRVFALPVAVPKGEPPPMPAVWE